MIQFLFRADDLGYSEGVNCGIAKSVIDGLIGSVGVMPNMPSVKHGLELLKGKKVCLGQHTNICIGKPLTDPRMIPSITQQNGEFKSSRDYRQATGDFVNLDEVILEIEAQYHRFIELTGEPPHYFEGHAVVSANFFRGLETVARRHGLKYSDISFDGTPIQIGNSRVHLCDTKECMDPNYDAIKTVIGAIQRAERDSINMYVCHPGYLDEYILEHSSMTTARPKEVEMLCAPQVKTFLDEKGIQLITYDDL